MRATALGLLLLLAGLSTAAPASATSSLDDWGTPLPGSECCLDVAVAPRQGEVLLLADDRSILRFSADGAPIGELPVRGAASLAVLGRRLYVLTNEPTRVLAWDLDRLEEGPVDRLSVGLTWGAELTAAAGSIWAMGGSDRHPDGVVVRIDPATGEQVESSPLMGSMFEARETDTAVWVETWDDEYCRLRPGVAECWPVPGLPSRYAPHLAAPGPGGEWLYRVYDDVVTRLLPGGGEAAAYDVLPGTDVQLLTASGDGETVAAFGFRGVPNAPEIALVGGIDDGVDLGPERLVLLEWGPADQLYAVAIGSTAYRFGVVDRSADADIVVPPGSQTDPPERRGGSLLSTIFQDEALALALVTLGVLSILIQLVPVTRRAPDAGSIRRGRRDAARYLTSGETVVGHVFGYRAQSVGGWLATTGLLWVLAFIVGITVGLLSGNRPLGVLLMATGLVIGSRVLLHHMLRPHRIVLTDRSLLVLPVHPFTWRPSGPGVEVPRGASSSSWRRGMTTWARFGTEDPVWVPPFWAQELRRIAEAESASPPVPVRPDR